MSPNTGATTQRVPFAWENQAGTPAINNSKTLIPNPTENTQDALKLPPPPSLQSGPKPSFHGLYVPLPPLPFHPPEKISPTKGGSGEEDDPFLMAYLECTKSVKHNNKVIGTVEIKKKYLWAKMKQVGIRLGTGLACNSNRHVREDDHDMLPQVSEFD